MELLDTLFSNPWYWLIAGAVVMGLEIFASGVYLLWIGAAMITTGLSLALFPSLPMAAHISIFIGTMIGFILLGIKIQSRMRRTAPSHLNAGPEQFIGKYAVTAQAFENRDNTLESPTAIRGRIRLEDTTYSAISYDALSEGQHVLITGLEDGIFKVQAA